ncbi:hypothetical protein F383_34899 [Gossypium arboreum]|uniref:Uncharacterized protein n=1 Tax=Gossypium arboreum TaxID=29729 RepID=A0A0B0PP13_GOSAR|nr:hypothetical protein F383_34899 [Gossypium arboreum]
MSRPWQNRAYILTCPHGHKTRSCGKPWYTDFNS